MEPAEASYYAPLHEFVLPYDAVHGGFAGRRFLAFAQSVYDAASLSGNGTAPRSRKRAQAAGLAALIM